MSEITQDEESLSMVDEENGELEINFDPEFFVKLALEFACFGDAKPETDPQELFDIIMRAYKEDNLSEEQDLVVELILHLHEESSPFNLKRALEIWSPSDRDTLRKIIAESGQLS